MYKKNLTLLALVTILFTSNAQTSEEYFSALNYSVPPSPDAGAIAEYASAPVSAYTGIPDISIPLGTVESRHLKLPLSINYHAGGVKVDEVASWIGLGWSLSAGGVISRSTSGLPDDDPTSGYLNLPALPELTPSNRSLLLDFAEGRKDSQPDAFSLSVPGKSFRFYIKKNGEILYVPDQQIKLEKTVSGGKIISWLLTDESGTKYVFDVEEETDVINYGTTVTRITKHVTSWYLSSIITPQGSDTITFEYADYFSQHLLHPSETYKALSLLNEQWSVYKLWGKKISKVNFTDGYVQFTTKAKRCDLDGNDAINTIDFYYDDKLTRSVKFYHSYFDQNGESPYQSGPCTDTVGLYNNDQWKRLKLDKITNVDSLGGELLIRSFDYSDVNLPKRLSNAQDHWGFYNGKSNDRLVPYQKIGTTHSGQDKYKVYPGADRSADEAYAVAGILNKMTYPTGGWTEYEYEGNTCESPELANEITIDQVTITEGDTSKGMLIDLLNDPFSIVTISPIQVPFADQNCYVRVGISGANYSGLFDFTKDSTALTLYIPAGIYTVTHEIINGACSTTDPYSFQVSWENEVETHHKVVGGLRVKQVRSYDPVAGDTLRMNYQYTLANGNSSGILNTIPFYGYFKTFYDAVVTTVFMRTSSASWSLDFTQGSPVGYREVTIINDTVSKSGKTKQSFYTALEKPDVASSTLQEVKDVVSVVDQSNESLVYDWETSYTVGLRYPFAPVDSRSWSRGIPKATTQFNDLGTLLKRDSTNYSFLNDGSIDGFVSTIDSYYNGSGYSNSAVIKNYTLTTGQYHPATSISQSYENNRELETVTNYAYDLSLGLLRKQSEEMLANDRIYKTAYTYLSELDLSAPYGSEPAYNALKKMYEDYSMRNLPVEVITYVSTDEGANFEYLSSQLLVYDDYGGEVFPSKRYSLNAKDLSAAYSNLTVSGSSLQFHQDYTLEQEILEYDQYGNIEKAVGRDGLVTLLTYDTTNHKYLIKQMVMDESDNVLSEVSFDHEPGFGVKKKTDQNGRFESYIYDTFGRLSTVKDHEGNILRAHEYHYTTEISN